MAIILFDVNAFRLEFPQFADPIAYPDAVLQAYWNAATCYISNNDYGYLSGDCRVYALNLMTAHLAYLATINKSSNYQEVPSLMQSAGIDKVNVSVTPPPLKNQWQWWLSLTPYGQTLYPLLFVNGLGGLWISGLPETAAFRRVGGIFV